MSTEIWLTYAAAVLLLVGTPGPSQLLMLSNSLANGFRRSMATAAGDLTANLLQMLAAGVGLGAVIIASETIFSIVKWLGVVYLVWMGAAKIRNAGNAVLIEKNPASIGVLWFQGFTTSAANPKAIVFFAALFPQFIQSDGNFWMQVVILSSTYLLLDGVMLTAYGRGASWAADRLSGRASRRLDHITGALLIAAGALLGIKSAPHPK